MIIMWKAHHKGGKRLKPCVQCQFLLPLLAIIGMYFLYKNSEISTELIPLMVVDYFLHPAKTFESSNILIESKIVLVQILSN